MKTVTKYEKDEQEKEILTKMVEALKDLHQNMHIDDIVEYFTDRMQWVAGGDADEPFSISFIDTTISTSCKLLQTNTKLFRLLEKYNTLKSA